MGLLLWLPDITLNKALPAYDWLDCVDKKEATISDKLRADWFICKLEAGLVYLKYFDWEARQV